MSHRHLGNDAHLTSGKGIQDENRITTIPNTTCFVLQEISTLRMKHLMFVGVSKFYTQFFISFSPLAGLDYWRSKIEVELFELKYIYQTFMAV